MTDDPIARDSPRQVLAALADDDALAILAAATAEPRSISELVERCGTPTSTTYRKVDELVDAGLLDEQTRMGPDGRHVSEYVLGTEGLVVSFAGPGSSELDSLIDAHRRARERRVSGDGEAVRVETDGGEDSGQPRHRRLQTLFVDVTGTEAVVDEQEPPDSSRDVDDATAPSVSEYVTSVAKDDGLSDTIDDPDAGDGAD